MKFYDKNGYVHRTRVTALISTIMGKPINPVTVYDPGKQATQSGWNSEVDLYATIDGTEIVDDAESDVLDTDGEQVDEPELFPDDGPTPRAITAQFDPDDPTLNSDDVVKKSVDTIAELAEEAKRL